MVKHPANLFLDHFIWIDPLALIISHYLTLAMVDRQKSK